MGLEVRPLGVKCNIQCQYCYQNPERDADNVLHDYDMEKLIAAVSQEKHAFTLFGGEPLLMPIADLETLFKLGCEKFGSNGIQTNGTLITEAHLALFQKYKVGVGISIDGPDELNDVRWANNLAQTREATARIMANIETLCERGMTPSLIITLHRNNAVAEKLPRMHEWVQELERIGVRSARLHLLEVESGDIRDKYALSEAENLAALMSFYELQQSMKTLRFDLFDDMRNMLLGRDKHATCVWKNCDPYTTAAVQGLEGSGQKSNCGRTNKDGIDFVKSRTDGYERYLALYQTPQAANGCQGCRFFLMCKGHCPGTSQALDWRNRTEHCEVWKGMYRHLENEMLDSGESPLSAAPERGEIEAAFVASWSRGQHTSMHWEIDQRNKRKAAAGGAAHKTSSQPARKGARLAEPDEYGMRRLGFRLPEFARHSWVSDAAEKTWTARIARIARVWQELEWRSVADGIRECAILFPKPEELIEYSAVLARHGLATLPVAMQATGSAYQAAAVKHSAGSPFLFRTAVGRLEHLVKFKDAVDHDDDHAIGGLLGYPECCREFYRHVWVDSGLMDPTWPQALNSGKPHPGQHLVELNAAPEANVLLRWLGVRGVPHLPCSLHCDATIALGRQFNELGRALGYTEEMDWLAEMLAWPLEWSCLHGIAEIKTPVAKISASTDATADKHMLRIKGSTYPDLGAQGLHFPYKQPRKLKFTQSIQFERGLSNPI